MIPIVSIRQESGMVFSIEQSSREKVYLPPAMQDKSVIGKTAQKVKK